MRKLDAKPAALLRLRSPLSAASESRANIGLANQPSMNESTRPEASRSSAIASSA